MFFDFDIVFLDVYLDVYLDVFRECVLKMCIEDAFVSEMECSRMSALRFECPC